MIRSINCFALLVGWAVLALYLLGSLGLGNFVLYYGLKGVIVITCDGCGTQEAATPTTSAPPAVDL